MTSTYQSGTIHTTFERHPGGGLRVRFSCPPAGYTFDDLDALLVAIEHARLKLAGQQTLARLPLDLEAAFQNQQARLAAPS